MNTAIIVLLIFNIIQQAYIGVMAQLDKSQLLYKLDVIEEEAIKSAYTLPPHIKSAMENVMEHYDVRMEEGSPTPCDSIRDHFNMSERPNL